MSRSDLQIDVHSCEDQSALKGLASPVVSQKLDEIKPGCRSVYNAEHVTLVLLLSWLAEKKRSAFQKWVDHGLARCTAEAIILRHPDVFDSDMLRKTCRNRLRKYAPGFAFE